MVRVKICGMTNAKDAIRAAKLGAWAVGFIFYKKSPRFVGAYKASKIISQLPPFVTPVGVFVNQKEGAVKDIIDCCGLKTIQLHGEESPAYCRRFRNVKVIKAFRVRERLDLEELQKYQTDAFLFDTYQPDTYGGSGQSFPWEWVKAAKNLGVPMILSGGLNAGNVRAAIDEVQPYAVDVASGVEAKPGEKSERLLKDFFTQLSPYS